jgi:signal transduction histidine kinase
MSTADHATDPRLTFDPTSPGGSARAGDAGRGSAGRVSHCLPLIISLYECARRAEAERDRRVAQARMLERSRLARDMHDVLAHRLSLVAMHAGALEYRANLSPEQLSRAAGIVRAGTHQALDELRDVIRLLRDDTADDSAEVPRQRWQDLPALVDECRVAGQPVHVQDTLPATPALPAIAGQTAYRIVQEALTNARKHAAGKPVHLALDGRPGERLVIEIRNPMPSGEATAPAVPGSGTGLLGLTERVRLAGGRLDHERTTHEFRLHAWLPWPA